MVKAYFVAFITSLLFAVAFSQCTVGDIVYQEGESTGYFQHECLNGTYWIGTESVCTEDGSIVGQPITGQCSAAAGVPHCIQCGPPGRHSSLCLPKPEVPSHCQDVTTDEQGEDQINEILSLKNVSSLKNSPTSGAHRIGAPLIVVLLICGLLKRDLY